MSDPVVHHVLGGHITKSVPLDRLPLRFFTTSVELHCKVCNDLVLLRVNVVLHRFSVCRVSYISESLTYFEFRNLNYSSKMYRTFVPITLFTIHFN